MPHVELMILLQLATKPCHGYQMMKSISADTGGKFEPGPGTLYVALRRLSDRGYIRALQEANDSTGRRLYCLTKTGKAILHEELVRLSDVLRQAKLARWQSPLKGFVK
jgi:DNA-binding PadR family transcriptional regulator